MTDSLPVVSAVLIVVMFFVMAMNMGVVKLLASGISALLALLTFSLAFHIVPNLADNFFDIQPDWKKTASISAGAAAFVYLVVRLLSGWLLKSLMGPGGWFHVLADGIPGAIVSFVPSFAIILFLFTCFRVSGTLHELHYTASLSRDGLPHMVEKIPPYPVSGRWRASVEDIPGVAFLMDFTDPFSNRRNRNAAAFAIMGQSTLVWSFLLNQPETAELAENKKIIDLKQEQALQKALTAQDRVALVMHPRVREVAKDRDVSEQLRYLALRPILEGYAKTIKLPTPVSPN